MSARQGLLLYVAAVLAVCLLHAPALLAGLLLLALLGSGAARGPLLRRTLRAVLVFNLSVSAGYALLAHWQGTFDALVLLRLNLRVALLVYLGFWFIGRFDLLAALRGLPLLSLLATLALGQMRVFERMLADFRQAFVSRNPVPAPLAVRVHQAAAQTATLIDKSLQAATEAAQAMRSRGVFDDPGSPR